MEELEPQLRSVALCWPARFHAERLLWFERGRACIEANC
jgi:hypothetical protein